MSPIFRTVPAIHFGWGAIEQLGPTVAQWGRQALLVTGRQALRQAGITERLLALLKVEGVDVVPFEKVEPEPDVTTCDAGRRMCREQSIEVVVGAGGGSALDAAKVIAGLANELPATHEYHGDRSASVPGLPFVAVPTTSGTGAEVTANGVISDRERVVKKSIRHPSFLARVAIVDPELTVSLPPAVTAYTGLDALVQAVESYTSRHACSLTEGLSLRAAELVAQHIRQAYEDGQDREARTAMSAGSLMAGIALANARCGIVHGLAHPLGVRLGLPHGLVCGVLFPHAVELNRDAAREKYERLAALVGVEVAEFTRTLLQEFDIAADLSAAGLREEDFPDIVAEAMTSGSTKANPKEVTEEDLQRMLEAVTG